MPTNVIMPALEMAQETGKVLRWLKRPGESVQKGEPLLEIETDKITVELEAPAAGVLGDVTAREGDVVPVGQTIAVIAGPGEPVGAAPAPAVPEVRHTGAAVRPAAPPAPSPVKVSPLARKLAEQHGVDLTQVKTASGKIEKADVLAYVEQRAAGAVSANGARLSAASPKARRRAAERGIDIATLRGSGPGGAVLAADVEAARGPAGRAEVPSVGTVWRVMAERMTQSWTTVPHFYLVREVNASRLVSWLAAARKQTGAKITYTDLLVRLVAATLTRHPAVNGGWRDGALIRNAEINIGLAVAIDDGLVVPVIHRADTLSLAEIAARREELVERAQSGRLRPADITGGTFTISNLGMFGVDAFSAIVNPPQAAILAVGRIANRVVPVNGVAAVQPVMVLTLSCDHRAVDGARGAEFVGTLAECVEEPAALIC